MSTTPDVITGDPARGRLAHQVQLVGQSIMAPTVRVPWPMSMIGEIRSTRLSG